MKNNENRPIGKLTRTEMIILVVIALVEGCFFMTSYRDYNDFIEREDAVSVSAVFESYDCTYAKGGHINYITLSFSDYENLIIDGSCVNDDILSEIDSIEKGTVLYMLVDEENGKIADLKTEATVLLEYDDVKMSVIFDRFSLFGYGIFSCCFALCVFIIVKKFVKKNILEDNNYI